jgi:hypothetical protein
VVAEENIAELQTAADLAVVAAVKQEHLPGVLELLGKVMLVETADKAALLLAVVAEALGLLVVIIVETTVALEVLA